MMFLCLHQISTTDGMGLGDVYVNMEEVSSFSQERRSYQSGGAFYGTTVIMKPGEVYFVGETPARIGGMMLTVSTAKQKVEEVR